MICLYSSMVERNTVNIFIDVQFILRAKKAFRHVSLMVELCVTATMIRVQVLYMSYLVFCLFSGFSVLRLFT